jgi:hypothetical protein
LQPETFSGYLISEFGDYLRLFDAAGLVNGAFSETFFVSFREIRRMNQLALNKPPNEINYRCPEITPMAERELGAFLGAITELFGPEQAHFATADWLHEFAASDGLPASPREWRRITVSAAARLASRGKRAFTKLNRKQ